MYVHGKAVVELLAGSSHAYHGDMEAPYRHIFRGTVMYTPTPDLCQYIHQSKKANTIIYNTAAYLNRHLTRTACSLLVKSRLIYSVP
jgi:hypothetical protein